jgi:hypothetical protein
LAANTNFVNHPVPQDPEEETPPDDDQNVAVQTRIPPTSVDQYPQASTETNLPLNAHRILCNCGLWAIRWATQGGRHFWKCPRLQGEQCDFSVWENKLHHLERDRWVLIEEESQEVDDFEMTYPPQYPDNGPDADSLF